LNIIAPKQDHSSPRFCALDGAGPKRVAFSANGILPALDRRFADFPVLRNRFAGLGSASPDKISRQN
jgi:hypothetical protein